MRLPSHSRQELVSALALFGGSSCLYLFLVFISPLLSLLFLVLIFVKLGLMVRTLYRPSVITYIDDTIAVVHRSLFIQVFSCRLPANLSDIPVLKFLVPLTIEVLPHRQLLRLFFYSRNVDELRHRCDLARKHLLHHLPALQPLPVSQLKSLFAPSEVYRLREQEYIARRAPHRTDWYLRYHPPSTNTSETLRACLRYLSTSSSDLVLVFPFVTQLLLQETMRPHSRADSLLAKAREPRASFQGPDLYIHLGSAVESESLVSNSDASESSSSALRVALRFPFDPVPPRSPDLGLEMVRDLLTFLHTTPVCAPSPKRPVSLRTASKLALSLVAKDSSA